MNKKEMVELGKILTLILRHKPENFGLELKKHIEKEKGYCDLNILVEALNKNIKRKTLYTLADLEEIVNEDSKHDKRRFKVVDGKICATHGHTAVKKEIEVGEQQGNIPSVLYHGTLNKNLDSILKNGLMPMSRQFVHLSSTIKTAMENVSRFKDKENCLIEIKTENCLDENRKQVEFLHTQGDIWLAKKILPEFLTIVENKIDNKINNKKTNNDYKDH